MYRRRETKRAFQQGVREGKAKGWGHGANGRYVKKGKHGPVQGMTEEEKELFPDVWASMLEKCCPIQEPEKEGPSRRLTPEQEALICRELSIYKRCSRVCSPRAFGGCKGHLYWASCPQQK